MPTYEDQIAQGEGIFRSRVVCEGWPHIFVDHPSLVRTLSDGRDQLLGLNPFSLRLSARADLARAVLREQEMTLEIADDDEHRITASLHRSPSLTTALMATCTANATSITVADTTGWPSSGVLHIGTEAIRYTGKTSTTFTGLTRGHWDSIAQAHFTGDGDKLAFPQVTNYPRALYGRRVYVYLYGAIDGASSLTSFWVTQSGDQMVTEASDPYVVTDAAEGFLRWRGIVRSDVDYSAGIYTFSVGPLSELLEQPIGGDLEEPTPISGIYLHAHGGCWKVELRRGSTADQGTAAATTDIATVTLSGRWKTQDEFCAAGTAAIASATASWSWGSGSSLRLEPLGLDGYKFVYVTGTSDPAYWVGVNGARIPGGGVGLSPVDLIGHQADLSAGSWSDETGVRVSTLLRNQRYQIEISAPVPRATLGLPSVEAPELEYFRDPDNGRVNVDGYIYLGGTVVPQQGMMAIVRAGGAEGDEEKWAEVLSVNATQRRIRVPSSQHAFALGPQSRVRLLRTIAKDVDFGGFIDQITADSPKVANTGALPLIGPDDWSHDWIELRNAIADLGLGAKRVYVTTGGVSLAEIVEHELRLVGCYLALDATGRLTVKRLGLALVTDAGSISINEGDIKGDFPSASKNTDGFLREAIIRQGWDPDEKEHKGPSFRCRNVQAPSPRGGALEIAPRSRQGGAIFTSDDPAEVGVEEANLLASGVLGLFGDSYEVIVLQCSLEHFHAVLGSGLLVTAENIPASDGTMGVSNKPMQIVGVDWVPWEGKGTLTLLTSDRPIAGYAPAALIASQVNTSGTTWQLTLSLADYTSSGADQWFAVNDEVRILQRNTASPTRVSGTVTAVTATVVTVLLDGAWAPGSDAWTLGYDRAPSVDVAPPGQRPWAQTAFVYVADTVRRLTFSSGDVDAYVFAP